MKIVCFPNLNIVNTSPEKLGKLIVVLYWLVSSSRQNQERYNMIGRYHKKNLANIRKKKIALYLC